MDKKDLPVIFDLETTGTDVREANVVQIAAVTAVFQPDGKAKASTLFSSMVNPGMPIPKEASEIHGITDEEVKWSPSQRRALETFSVILQNLSLDYNVILAGQNIERYDVPIIKRIMPGRFDIYPTLDTYTAAIRMFPDREHKLGPWYEWYTGYKEVNAHDAAADCHMCAHIIGRLLVDTGKSLSELVDWMYEPQMLTHMPFGKYKGQEIKKVPKSYWAWVAQNFHEPHKDVELTTCSVLGQEVC